MPERQALLDAATELKAATERLAEQFESVDQFAHETNTLAKKTNRLARWLVAAFAILVVYAAVLTVTTVRANHANDKATRQGEYQVANCEAGNQFRADNKALWDDVEGLVAGLGDSPKNRAFVAALQAKADKAYTPRDCSKVVEGKVR